MPILLIRNRDIKDLSDLVMQNVLLQLETELLSSPLGLEYPFSLKMCFQSPF